MLEFDLLSRVQSELMAKRYLPFGTSSDDPQGNGVLSSHIANQAMTGSMVITSIGFGKKGLCFVSILF